MAEEYINYVFTNAVPKALTQEDIMITTEEDATLQAVILARVSGIMYSHHTSSIWLPLMP